MGRPTGEGAPGHVEGIASGAALARDGAALVERGEAPELARLASDGVTMDAAAVCARPRTRATPPAARSSIERGARSVATCAGLVNVLNPRSSSWAGPSPTTALRASTPRSGAKSASGLSPSRGAGPGGGLPVRGERLARRLLAAHPRPGGSNTHDHSNRDQWLGRIGRQSLRAILERHPDELEVVALNDLAPTATNAHLFRYDSTYGRYPGEVTSGDGEITVDGHAIRAFSEKDPAALPWADLGRPDRARVHRRVHRWPRRPGPTSTPARRR